MHGLRPYTYTKIKTILKCSYAGSLLYIKKTPLHQQVKIPEFKKLLITRNFFYNKISNKDFQEHQEYGEIFCHHASNIDKFITDVLPNLKLENLLVEPKLLTTFQKPVLCYQNAFLSGKLDLITFNKHTYRIINLKFSEDQTFTNIKATIHCLLSKLWLKLPEGTYYTYNLEDGQISTCSALMSIEELKEILNLCEQKVLTPVKQKTDFCDYCKVKNICQKEEEGSNMKKEEREGKEGGGEENARKDTEFTCSEQVP